MVVNHYTYITTLYKMLLEMLKGYSPLRTRERRDTQSDTKKPKYRYTSAFHREVIVFKQKVISTLLLLPMYF